MAFFKSLWTDQSGAAAAEYALILAIVGTGIAVAAYALGGEIKNSINTAANCVKNAQSGTC
ncbi:Flp family type IVb pilin [Sphingobium sp. LB126]|uniref:Flp family type IVb pilin n=1 Tax=Sphingobium sp. LB126 TaxID=1983755 RepID=UPI000C20CCD4|nr:Flp family type IVb pilin [Sphingobium sp. LB126]PJG46975.1 Flp family type IVb pilin [Sphingobium sp. LB126]